MGRRHHFVPRFYLKPFQSSEKRIHLYNIPRRLVAADVSLRDQCYARNLYGADGALEAAFADLEGLTATVISRLRETSVPPPVGSQEHLGLVAFAAFQLVRTPAAHESAAAMSEKLVQAVFDGPGPPDARMTPDEALALMLGAGPEILKAMLDLSVALVRLERPHFFTSDNPAFRYNMYCEGVHGLGVTGAKSRGLQVFVPLAPDLLMLLYDGSVYKIGSRGQHNLVWGSALDVGALNRLQFVSALSNVYFGDWGLASQCDALALGVTKQRAASGPRLRKAYNTSDDRDVLLHQYWPMPQLKLHLSFVKIRRNARRVSLVERGQLLRDGRKTGSGPMGPNTTVRFATRNER